MKISENQKRFVEKSFKYDPPPQRHIISEQIWREW
jgi:hypothetical protein